jgi:hypothetical protein
MCHLITIGMLQFIRLAPFKRNAIRQNLWVILPLFLFFSTNVYAQKTWTGAENTSWNNAANWQGGVPGEEDDVVIASAVNQPVIGHGASVVVKSVFVGDNATLTIAIDNSISILSAVAFTTPSSFTAGLNNKGTVINNGDIIFSSPINEGQFALFNQKEFENTATGKIRIERSSGAGLYNITAASFVNWKLYDNTVSEIREYLPITLRVSFVLTDLQFMVFLMIQVHWKMAENLTLGDILKQEPQLFRIMEH